ncbi:MAG TPA: hypothetical protein GXX46_13320 [Peptococcaceae bacterium]|nr:hypothetical protein [Peptococcaceae bacterium]
MRINNNIAALNAWRGLTQTDSALGKSLEKLSSGLRINRAGDDAAGLAISEKMRAQIKGLNMASKNAQDGISLIQTAEGALNETHSILQRMRELAVQAASDTNSDTDRAELQKEVDQLISEIDRIATDTEFNTKKLLNGQMGKTYSVSANTFNHSPQNIQIVGDDIKTGTYTLTATAMGTDTVTLNTHTAAASFEDTDISVADGTKFGTYTLNVTGFDGVGGTANFTLTGPDGKEYDVGNQAIDDALTVDLSGGGSITFAFDNNAVTGDGSIEFRLTNVGIEIDLSGAKTVDTSAISSYAGETLNIGGIKFELRWGAADANGDAISLDVEDRSISFQIGANSGQTTSLAINNMGATALGVNEIDVSTKSGATAAIDTISNALDTVSSERAKLGAMQNRLEHTITNLGVAAENLTAAESRIRDVDMAAEMMEFTKKNILAQAGTAMLAQANMRPQSVLQLLQ